VKVFTNNEELLGKKVYKDARLEKIKERYHSEKASFVSIEFTDKNRDACECVLARGEEKLDLILEDIEKTEVLLGKVDDERRGILERAKKLLEEEKLLFETLEPQARAMIKEFALVTAKPIIFWDNQDEDKLLARVIDESAQVCFFTASRKEARAWLIEKGQTVLTAAAKIHSDLARGFIRAEVYNTKDMDDFKNPQEGQQKGLVHIVDKTYIVSDGDVVAIKFNVSK